MSDKAVLAIVSGQVQQVGFRQSCRHVARSLELTGWVRNLPDGRVEVMAQGRIDNVDGLVAWLWTGPRSARVTGIESDTVAIDPSIEDFFIYPNPSR